MVFIIYYFCIFNLLKTNNISSQRKARCYFKICQLEFLRGVYILGAIYPKKNNKSGYRSGQTKLLWPQCLVQQQRSIYLRQHLTKLIPDISLNSCADGFKLQERFRAQASGGAIHKHGVYFVKDVLERLGSSLIFFVLCGHLFTFQNTPADPHLSEKEACSHGRAPWLISQAQSTEDTCGDAVFPF